MYRLVNVPVDNLRYRWESELFDGDLKKKKTKLQVFRDFEANQNTFSSELKQLHENLKRKGLLKPLIIKQAWYDREFDFNSNHSYVVVGNQRLCILKTMPAQELENTIVNHNRRVPCVVCRKDDNWGDNTGPVGFLEQEPTIGISINDLHYVNFDSRNYVKIPDIVTGKTTGRINQVIDKSYFNKVLNQVAWLTNLEKTLPSLKKDDEMNQKTRTLFKVYSSIRDRGMMNPLMVKMDFDGNFYVHVGKQRLCSLKALEYQGLVPCHVFNNKTNLEDILSKHPYREVKYD